MTEGLLLPMIIYLLIGNILVWSIYNIGANLYAKHRNKGLDKI